MLLPLQVWITTIVACLCVTMSTSAVDNHQNAIADNIAGVWLKDYSVWWARLLVLGLNVPCIIVSLRVSNHCNKLRNFGSCVGFSNA